MTTNPSIQERKFLSFFNHLDADKDGVLSWNDILRPAEKARVELGWTKTSPKYTTVMQFMRAGWDACLKTSDLDHNGTITYKEYVAFFFRSAVESVVSGKPPSWAMVTGDGITPSEHAIYLRSIGSTADAKSVFAKLDINKNGKISIDELHLLLWQWMGSNDPDSPGNYLMTGKF
ncbi:hypothetical protein F0U59_03515 [Archangium gephyra]|nr:hypothetical protein F0U59_03515 [Archangium gephyra]